MKDEQRSSPTYINRKLNKQITYCQPKVKVTFGITSAIYLNLIMFLPFVDPAINISKVYMTDTSGKEVHS